MSPSELCIIIMVEGRIISEPPDLRYTFSCVLLLFQSFTMFEPMCRFIHVNGTLVRSPPNLMETHEHGVNPADILFFYFLFIVQVQIHCTLLKVTKAK